MGKSGKARRKRNSQSSNTHTKLQIPRPNEIANAVVCSLLQSYLPLAAGTGHLSASTYDALLEQHEKDAWMPQEEEDLDCICQALEVEESRRGLIQALKRVAQVLSETVETYSSHSHNSIQPDLDSTNRIDRNCIQFNTNLSARNDNTSIRVQLPYETLETALCQLNDCLQAHETQLVSFRSNVYSWALSLSRAFAKTTTCSTGSKRTCDDFPQQQTHNAMGKYYQYFDSVQRDALQHVGWEQSLLLKLQTMMEDGRFYSPFTDSLLGSHDDDNQNERIRVAQVLGDTLRQWAEGLSFRTNGGAWKQSPTLNWIHTMVEDFSMDHNGNANEIQEQVQEKQNTQEQGIKSSIVPTLEEEDKTTSTTTCTNTQQTHILHPKCKAMLSCPPLESFLESFLEHSKAADTRNNNPITFALLVGAPNSGKTHLCQSLAVHLQQSYPNTLVLRPRLASALNGATVGSAEDSIISLLEYALLGGRVQQGKSATINNSSGERQKCILILDDVVEHILGSSNNKGVSSGHDSVGTKPNHLAIRKRAVWFSLMDHINAKNSKCRQEQFPRQVLILCTAGAPRQSSNGSMILEDDDSLNRFEKVFFMDLPNAEERRDMIQSLLGIIPDPSIDQTLVSAGGQTLLQPNETSPMEEQYEDIDVSVRERLLTIIVESTIGKTRGEISLYCRDAYRGCNNNSLEQLSPQEMKTLSPQEIQTRLKRLKTALQERVPESVAPSTIKGDANLTVVSARELRAGLRLDEEGNDLLPLIGSHAAKVFKRLEDLVISPLCRWKALDELLYGGSPAFSQRRVSRRGGICAGVLLTGEPGSGKSAIAYHCAAVAAGIDPSIRLLDVPCTSLIHKEVGGSERSLQRLFRAARAAAPCILILDGVENIAPVRGNDNTTEGTMDRLLSTLLTEMDGIGSDDGSSLNEKSQNVAVIGVTHNPPTWIDPALRRPGRLEKCLLMEAPESDARRNIILKELEAVPIDFSGASFFEPKNKEKLAESIAMVTHGKSAAEVIFICKEARVFALREHLDDISFMDLGLDPSKIRSNIALSLTHRHFLKAAGI